MRKRLINKLKGMIWFLTLNFFNENSGSYLSEGGFIEDGFIYNSSYSELCYDIGDIRLSVIVDDETTIFQVHAGRKHFYNGERVFDNDTDHTTGEE